MKPQPLKELSEIVDKSDESFYDETKVTFIKCLHNITVISPTEAKCNKCGAGWTGNGIHMLVKLLQTT